jgi:hypothetical protein
MRQLILMTTLAVGTVAASLPAQAQYLHCIKGRGCVPTTQASYNACFQLALNRGLNVSVGDRKNLNFFIYQCLQGKIPFRG